MGVAAMGPSVTAGSGVPAATTVRLASWEDHAAEVPSKLALSNSSDTPPATNGVQSTQKTQSAHVRMHAVLIVQGEAGGFVVLDGNSPGQSSLLVDAVQR